MAEIIISVEGQTPGSPGVALEYAYSVVSPTPPLVTLSIDDDTGVTGYTWEIVDQPVGASATLSSETAASPTFTPTADVSGTYLIRVTLDGTSEVLTNAVAFSTRYLSLRKPAMGELYEYPGKGFLVDFEEIIDAVDDGGGGMYSPLTSQGDVYVHDAGGDTRQPIGTNNQFFRVNTSNSTYLDWVTLVESMVGFDDSTGHTHSGSGNDGTPINITDVIDGIGGSIASSQIAYGSGSDTIAGSANLTFDGTDGITLNTGLISIGYSTRCTAMGDGLPGNIGTASGANNTWYGYGSGEGVEGGDNNTGIGAYSLQGAINTDNNTAVGFRAGMLAYGQGNTLIGSRAGDNITSGQLNIIIGNGLDASAVNIDRELNIGNIILGDMNTERIQIGGSIPGTWGDASIRLAMTDAAFIPNVLTTTQRDALTAENGMIIYNSTLGTIQARNGGSWENIPGNQGDVTAALNITDNTIVRGDGGAKGIQDSGITIDDSNNISGAVNVTNTGYYQLADISAPSNPGAGLGRLYKKTSDDGLFWLPDAAGSEVDLTSTVPSAHASTHENGGSDEVSIADLDGIPGTASDTQILYGSGTNVAGSANLVFDSANGRVRIGGSGAMSGDASIRCAETDAAFMPNVLTTTQRNAITPENGMYIYNSTLGVFQEYQNGGWVSSLTNSQYVSLTGSGDCTIHYHSNSIHDDTAGEIAAISLKSNPVSADYLLIEDTEDSNNKKRTTIGAIFPTTTKGDLFTYSTDHDRLAIGSDYRFLWANSATSTGMEWIVLTEGMVQFDDSAGHTHSGTGNDGSQIDHGDLLNDGTNTHAQIDSHISSTANPHSTSIANIGTGTLAQLNSAVSDASLISNSSSEISAIALKSTPTITDELLIEDAADSYSKKSITLGSIPGARWDVVTQIDSSDSPYTASIGELVRADPQSGGGGEITVNLPAIAASNKGLAIAVKAYYNGQPGYDIDVIPNGADTIDEIKIFVLDDDNQWAVFVSDGTSNWIQLG